MEDPTAPGGVTREFGPYRVVRSLGRGAMGAVYEAHHTGLDRPVALKLLLDPMAGDTRRRFLRELELSCNLCHPALVRVLDVGEIDGTAYLAMELVEGETLQALIDYSAPIDWRIALAIVVRLAEGLAYLHERNMLHRDVKPANVLLSHAGDVKLADFGLLRDVDSTRLTEDGRVVGTMLYMSPEMISLGELSPASDLWAVGCIAYQLLTGERVWRASSATGFVEAIVSQRVTLPDEIVRSVPPAVSQLVLALLERNPEHRLAVAGTLKDEAALLLELIGHTSADQILTDGFQGRLARLDPSAVAAPESTGSATAPLAPATPTPGRDGRRRPSRPVSAQAVSGPSMPGRQRFYALGFATGIVLVLASAMLPSRTRPLPTARPPAGASPTAPRPTDGGDASPSPAASTRALQPTDLFARWSNCSQLLVDLIAGGDRAARAVAEARRRAAPVDLGDRPARWRFWIELGQWLETGRQNRIPVILGPGPTSAQVSTSHLVSEKLLGELGGRPRAKDILPLLERLESAPDDGRWWLVLARILELEQREDQAVRVYRIAMERLKDRQLDITARMAWAGLTRALLLARGRTFESEIWRWAAWSREPLHAYEGIEDVLMVENPARYQALLESGTARKEHGEAAYLALGRYWILRQDTARGIATWTEGWKRHPASEELERKAKGLPRRPRPGTR